MHILSSTRNLGKDKADDIQVQQLPLSDAVPRRQSSDSIATDSFLYCVD